MKIGLVSDIHEDHWLYQAGMSAIELIEPGVCDILVVAGDLCQVGLDEDGFLGKLRALKEKAPEVVYVPGNHEYYQEEFSRIHELMEKAADTADVVMLGGTAAFANVAGLPFIGGSMWYDYDERDVKDFLPSWSDMCIKQLTSCAANLRYEEMKTLKRDCNDKTIVVSHFLPSHRSVHPKYAGNEANCVFVSQGLEAIVREHRPKLWLHGHTHMPCDYQFFQTRVVCNPLGYPREIGTLLKDSSSRKMPFVLEV